MRNCLLPLLALMLVGASASGATTIKASLSPAQALKAREAKINKLLRKRDKYASSCPESDTGCIRAREVEAEIQELRSKPL